jgi:hypothetical protein
MALQSSGEISLDDIRIELGLSQSNVSLGSMSNTAGKSDPDAMSEFYGYSGSTTWYSFTSTTSPNSFACFITASGTRWTDAVNAQISVGDKIRTNSAGTGLPSSGNYKHDSEDVAYTVNSSGIITNIANC